MCMAADKRIGMAGDFKIGLNEVGIGMTLPVFGVEFALARLSPRHQTRAVVEAELYSPEGAVEAGFLDWVTSPEQLVDEAFAEAARLSALDPNAHRNTKLRLRKEFIARIQASLEDDKRELSGAGG